MLPWWSWTVLRGMWRCGSDWGLMIEEEEKKETIAQPGMEVGSSKPGVLLTLVDDAPSRRVTYALLPSFLTYRPEGLGTVKSSIGGVSGVSRGQAA